MDTIEPSGDVDRGTPLVNWQRSLHRTRSALRFALGAFVVVCAMRLPVEAFWIRYMTTPDHGTNVQDGVDSVVIGIQIIAAMLGARRILPSKNLLFWMCPFGVMILAFWMSFLWSSTPGTSSREVALLLVNFLALAYVFLDDRLERVVLMILVGASIPTSISAWAVHRGWGYQPFTQIWQGIYTNRNFLAPACAIGAACGVGAFFLYAIVHRKYVIGILLIAPLTVFNTFALLKTRSGASLVGFALFLATWLGIGLLRSIRQRVPAVLRVLPLLVPATIASSIFMVTRFANSISALFGKSPGLSGRVEIWDAALRGVMERPILGWGWMSAWFTPAFRQDLPPSLESQNWSHSAIIDFLLGGGLALSIPFFVWIFARTHRAVVLALVDKYQIMMVSLSVLVLTILSAESLHVGNHYLFSFLVWGLIYGDVARPRLHASARSCFD